MNFSALALAMALSVIPAPKTYALGSNPNWTHWVIESSTDLVHWQNFNDYTIETNSNGTWSAAVKPTDQQRFFRTVGDFN